MISVGEKMKIKQQQKNYFKFLQNKKKEELFKKQQEIIRQQELAALIPEPYNSREGQDQFIVNILNHKKNGYFLEIGSYDAVDGNNTYVLEKIYNWKGLMVEYDKNCEESYKKYRNSDYIIEDATKIDYNKILTDLNFPKNIDYLQIDLDVDNKSTLQTLELLNDTIFDNYKFSVITFEHDIYRGDYFNTKNKSREIFKNRGYYLIFNDVQTTDGRKFEDWYINPSHLDMNFVNNISTDVSLRWYEIIEKLRKTNK